MKKGALKNIFIIGFALFAMFFGAGNLIFPPYLGLMAGENWFIAFLCFMGIDIGLSILTLLVIIRIGKGSCGITEKLGSLPSRLILALNAVCLGPLIAIPRTSATAYEFSVAPFFPEVNASVFSVIFFAIVVLFCLKQTKVIDLIGTIFAPLILGALIILIVKGILAPVGTIETAASLQAATESGINAGYQTMDVMAAMIFSSSLLMTLHQKDYTESDTQFRILACAGVVAAIILFIVYGGLAYLGATASGLYSADIDRVSLLIAITRMLLGENGMILLGILVCIACITPSIGLLSSAALFFEKETNGRISYRTFVFLFAGVSCLISNFGIDRILKLATPILNMIYPVLILLIFLGIFRRWIPYDIVYRFSALSVVTVSVLTTFREYVRIPVDVSELPLYQYGFQWMLPALLCGVFGLLIADSRASVNSVLLTTVYR